MNARETEAALKRLGEALGPRVPVGRSFLNDAVEQKLGTTQFHSRAPWSELTPEEQAAATVAAEQAESDAIDAAVTAARAEAAAEQSKGFGGGTQSASPPPGENWPDSIRRQILG